jgi:signal transduction histidine kinase
LINSIQAIGMNGDIKIICRLKTLKNNLSDFGFIDKKSDDSNNSGYKIKLLKGERIVSVEVLDSGKGIPQRDLKKIFDPFFTTKENGSGLGLAMVKKTVNNHGGIVQVKSEEGKGTVIKLLLPVRENV